MADQPITTSIDDLVKYLNEHGETDSSTLAAALKVGESIIETWADVLEKAQIVRVSYKLGKMFVSPMTISKEGEEAARKTIELRRGTAEAELASQIDAVNQINAKLDEFAKYIAGAEGAFKAKAGQIKETIDQIDRLSLQVDSAYKRLKEKKDYIDQMSAKLDKEAAQLEEKAKAATSITASGSDPRQVIYDIRAKLDDSEARLRALNASMNSTLEQSRKSFMQLADSVREETRLLKDMLAQREKEMQEYDSFLKSYKQESESIKRKVSQERIRMLDDVAKSSDEARKIYAVAEKRISEVKKTLDETKSQFGGFANLSDRINAIKSSMDSISRQKDDLKKELDELQEQLEAISAISDAKIATKSDEMQRAEQRMSGTARKTEQLGRQVDDLKKGIDELAK
jgi:chromosome segregation ATPase